MSVKKTSGVMIKPYYDGLLLVGIQNVAGDGLSVLSIKEKHNNCRFTVDPDTKNPIISCARGLKARNSFWNLHKPDLRKVKGLECSTTESVAHMFHKHSSNNAGKPSYKKRMLRLLESLVPNKARCQQRTLPLVQNEAGSWPLNKCVLAGICHEEEVKLNGMFKSEAETQSTFHFPGRKRESSREAVEDTTPITTDNISVDETCTITMESSEVDFGTLEPPKSYNSINIEHFSGALDAEECEEDSPLTRDNSFGQTQVLLETEMKKSTPQVVLSPCEVNNHKQPEDECVEMPETTEEVRDPSVTENMSRSKMAKQLLDNEYDTGAQLDMEASEDSSTKTVQSMFVDMFKEMQDIEEYINSYISSFCPLEEEFDNHPVLKISSDCVLHFLDRVNSPTKVTICRDKKNEIYLKNYLDTNNEPCTVEIKNHTKLHENLEPVCSEVSKCSYTFAKEGINNEMKQTSGNNDLSDKVTKNSCASFPDTLNTLTNDSCSEQSGHCYWEDSDLKDETEVLASDIPLPVNNTSLVDVQFFESLWKEIIDSIGGNTFNLFHNRSFFQQKQWSNPYNQSFIGETGNIIDTIDSFINNECFPCQESVNYTPCSILEIRDDDIEEVSLKERYASHQCLTTPHAEESFDKIHAKCKIITKSEVFDYFQHLSESTSNLSLYPEDELKGNESISLDNSQKRNTSLHSNDTLESGKISEENLTNSDVAISTSVKGYNLKANTISTTSLSKNVKLGMAQKVSKNIPNHGSTKSVKGSIDNSTLISEINIELVPAYSDLAFDVVTVSETEINQNGQNTTNVEICDSLLKKTCKTSTKDPEMLIKLENITDNIVEVKNSTDLLLEEKLHVHNLFKDEISKSCSVCNSTEKTDGLAKALTVPSGHNKLENDISKSDKQENCINPDRSMFVQIPENENTSQTNPQFIFSSAKVQLNLTNPVLNVNKK